MISTHRKKNGLFETVHKYSWLLRDWEAWAIEVSHQWYFCVEFCLEIQHGKQESQHEVKGKKGETAHKGKVAPIKLGIVPCAPNILGISVKTATRNSSTSWDSLGIPKSLGHSKEISLRLCAA